MTKLLKLSSQHYVNMNHIIAIQHYKLKSNTFKLTTNSQDTILNMRVPLIYKFDEFHNQEEYNTLKQWLETQCE